MSERNGGRRTSTTTWNGPKLCRECGHLLPVGEFGGSATGFGGLRARCRKCIYGQVCPYGHPRPADTRPGKDGRRRCQECKRERERGRRPGHLTAKFCGKCCESKPIAEFDRNANRKDGLQVWCKDCLKARRVAAYHANLEAGRQAGRNYYHRNRESLIWRGLRKYGVTREWYEQQLTRQGGCCACCGRTPEMCGEPRLSVDHRHRDGRVRMLLCKRCNLALGMVDESVYRLRRMISYLERHMGDDGAAS